MANCGQMVYFHGVMWAEMRKSVSYKVDISVRDGTISEAQCECAAGQGPLAHCKHVGTVLFSLHMFQLKRELFWEETCTQVRIIILRICLIKLIKVIHKFWLKFAFSISKQQVLCTSVPQIKTLKNVTGPQSCSAYLMFVEVSLF